METAENMRAYWYGRIYFRSIILDTFSTGINGGWISNKHNISKTKLTVVARSEMR